MSKHILGRGSAENTRPTQRARVTDTVANNFANNFSIPPIEGIDDLSDVSEENEIFKAVVSGDVSRVNSLITADPSLVDSTTETEEALLHYAARCGHNSIVELLIKHGVCINAADEELRTPIYWATVIGNLGIVKQLVEAGVDVIDEGPNKLLVVAIAEDNIDIATYLLESGVNVNEIDDYSRYTPLTIAIETVDIGDTSLLETLIARGADVNLAGGSVGTPLHHAVYWDDVVVIEFLLNHGARIDIKDRHGHSPIHAAAFYGKLNALRLLYQNHSDDFYNVTESGETIMHIAVRSHIISLNESLEILRFAFDEAGLDIATRNKEGYTALDVAAISGKSEHVKYLINCGAENGAIIWHKIPSLNITQMLAAVEYSAKPTIEENHETKESFNFAIANGLERVVVNLLRKDICFEVSGMNLLQYAIQHFEYRSYIFQIMDLKFEWLFETDKSGNTPLLAALSAIRQPGADDDPETVKAIHQKNALLKDIAGYAVSKGAEINVENDAGQTVFSLLSIDIPVGDDGVAVSDEGTLRSLVSITIHNLFAEADATHPVAEAPDTGEGGASASASASAGASTADYLLLQADIDAMEINPDEVFAAGESGE